MAIGAGQLTERFRFDKRSPTNDRYGGGETAFAAVFECWSARKFLRGGEAVQASRLDGKQPVLLTVRNSSQSRQITTDWRAVDKRSGESFNIIAVNPTPDRLWIEILCVGGVGDG